jgi:glycosyltransferase involved in cell wall biosynthesis
MLNQAAAMVNPLRFGTGIKLKVIEALARGLPVVSTLVGAESFDTGPAAGVLVGKNAEEFAELMCDLTDPLRNTELSEAARAHFIAKYAREAVFRTYDAVFALD